MKLSSSLFAGYSILQDPGYGQGTRLTTMGRMAKEEAYEVLGLQGEETEEEIKRAYRKKSLATHPDKNPVRTAAEENVLFLCGL